MAQQFSDAVRNAWLDTYESTIGAAPTMEIRTGSQPANCAAADSGTVLATVVLPSDWMAAASGGGKSKTGTWEDATADASGEAGHFRIKQGGTCHHQGSVGVGAGDLQVTSTTFMAGQPFSVTDFTLTAPGA